MIKKKIIVTGCAGFIGSHTVDRLLAEGHFVYGVDNFRTGRKENLKCALRYPRFNLEELDIAEGSLFMDFTKRINADVIIHLAALVSVPESILNPALNERLNFHATHVVAEAAYRYKVGRIVFASSSAVYGDNAIYQPIAESAANNPISPYGLAKFASENLLLDYSRKHGIIVRCQRYFNVYGPRQDPSSVYSGVISIFSDHLNRNVRPKIYGDGSQSRDFIAVGDVARANLLAATKQDVGTGVVNICTGETTTIMQIWEIMAQTHASQVIPIHAAARTGDIKYSCGSPVAAMIELGFKAKLKLPLELGELAKAGLRIT